jgi:hypothetical protein
MVEGNETKIIIKSNFKTFHANEGVPALNFWFCYEELPKQNVEKSSKSLNANVHQ